MKSTPGAALNSIDVQFALASAWHARGNLKAAKSGYAQILRANPEYAPVYAKLGELMEANGNSAAALEYFDKFLQLNPHDALVRLRLNFLKDQLGGTAGPSIPGSDSLVSPHKLPENPEGKINLDNQVKFVCHRSGWDFAIEALAKLHNSHGVMFDGFIEVNFAWKHQLPRERGPDVPKVQIKAGKLAMHATSEELGIVPYKEPWVGCIHNPQGMPRWFHFETAPQTIFAKPIWQESLDHCRGLFAFSRYHANWLREQTGKRVSVLTHPTEIPDRQFEIETFLSNPTKKIVQLGWWLRRLSAIYQLPLPRDNPLNYQKLRLIPMFADDADTQLRDLIAKEIETFNLLIPDEFADNTLEEFHVSNVEYDHLLSRNIAFTHLYDASANNAVIECIARATPLLVNPLPAVVEYLGEDYPFYFSDLTEAADKALDLDLIERTHRYLKVCPTRAKLHRDYFLRSFIDSEIYQAL